MALKNVALGYGGSDNTDAALRLVVDLCHKHGAAMTGIYVCAPLAEEPQFKTWMPESLLQSLQEASHDNVGKAETKFRDSAASLKYRGDMEWAVVEGDVDECLSRIARYHDLLVIGQHTQSDETARYRVQPENVVMRSGKPLLVVPADYTLNECAHRQITIAWDGSRSAARALSDALHLFGKNAGQYKIVRVVGKDRHTEMVPVPGRDIMKFMVRHGVDAQLVTINANKHQVAGTLAQYCADTKSNFLVMGAYGHSRLRDELFNSVTRTVLETAKTPVLLSH